MLICWLIHQNFPCNKIFSGDWMDGNRRWFKALLCTFLKHFCSINGSINEETRFWFPWMPGIQFNWQRTLCLFILLIHIFIFTLKCIYWLRDKWRHANRGRVWQRGRVLCILSSKWVLCSPISDEITITITSWSIITPSLGSHSNDGLAPPKNC